MKRIVGVLLAIITLLSVSATSFADHLKDANWTVTYRADGTLVPEYREDVKHKTEDDEKTINFTDYIRGLQPGDDITLTVTLVNENSQRGDWYMTNEVFKSLEDRSQSGSSGGAYTYKLTYTGPTQTRELFNSDTVGGEIVSPEGVGLHEATDALKDYFYLDSLERGQTATVVLNVALDGESQGNRYQDTKAFLQMNFAVQQRDRRAVKTGDDTNLTPLYVIALLSGIGILILAIRDLRARKRGNHMKSSRRRSEV